MSTWSLTESLDTIDSHWPALSDPEPTSGPSNPGSRGGEQWRVPGGWQRLHLAEAITRWVAYWTRAVLDEHACATIPLHACDTATCARWLRTHTGWIESQPDAPEEVELLSDLAKATQAVLSPSGVRRPPVGACPHEDCEGTIRAHLGDDQASTLACDSDPRHWWDELSWRDLGATMGHIGEHAPERMHPEQLAAWLSARFRRPITRANIDLWKHRHAWFPRPHADGTYDRIRVTEWLIERHAA